MHVERIAGRGGALGGYYVSPAIKPYALAHGTMTVDFSQVPNDRRTKLVTAIKRGYSRGNERSEQYILYALLCQHFGLLPSRISNARQNWVAVPDDINDKELVTIVTDKLKPIMQLTGDKEGLRYNDYWNGADFILGQRVVKFWRPSKVPMNVMGKMMMELLPKQDYAKQVAAMDFIKSGGVIKADF